MTTISTLPICHSRLLLEVPNLIHGVTRRVPGLGKADGNLGYSAPRDRDDALAMRALWRQALGLDDADFVGIHQVHGSGSHVARRSDPRPEEAVKADALITADRGLALMTLHADCMPIILCDPDVPVIATIHAGWRGTTLGIAARTAATMASEFGARPERMIAFLGPAIGACCYEVGEEVVEAWVAARGSASTGAIRPFNDRWTFDLDRANREMLGEAGLADARTESSGICTKCGGPDWFSHRGQGPLTGRYGSIVALI